MDKNILAIDCGASSGRVVLGKFDGDKIHLEEIHRFTNEPVLLRGTLYWDILSIYKEIKKGIQKASMQSTISSMGIDTWGVDFGLLDKDGKLLENPVHYRDVRTHGMMDKVFEKIRKEKLYQITGNQFMEINTIFQLYSLKEMRPELLGHASTMLMIPDLLNYFFTGVCVTEPTIASTTQLLDAKQGDWSDLVISALSLPDRILPPMISTGSIVGTITQELCRELEIQPIPVIAVAGHDTQSAMAAIPTQEETFAFISCGTWSLFGTEIDAPILTDRAYESNVTNEQGYGKKTSFLKNIIGLWILQECRRYWMIEGKEYSFEELEEMAKLDVRKQDEEAIYIDVDAPEFATPGNMPKRVQRYCQKTKQKVPQTEGEIARCIIQSLAMKYREALLQIEHCTGNVYETISLVGGGVNSHYLCQMTANTCQRKVQAGPIETTVLGNMVVQLMATSAIKNLKEAREVVARSCELACYEPDQTRDWDKEYQRYLGMIQNGSERTQ